MEVKLNTHFDNFYALKRYLTAVANNNNYKINLNDYYGLEKIYKYLYKHKDKVSYDFSFTDWIKLVANNSIEELKSIC